MAGGPLDLGPCFFAQSQRVAFGLALGRAPPALEPSPTVLLHLANFGDTSELYFITLILQDLGYYLEICKGI